MGDEKKAQRLSGVPVDRQEVWDILMAPSNANCCAWPCRVFKAVFLVPALRRGLLTFQYNRSGGVWCLKNSRVAAE